MPKSNCKLCRTEFIYDEELGLNIAYFEGETTRTHFRAGGDFPSCPNCGAVCAFEKTTFGWSDMKITTRFVLKEPPKLKEK